jgi:hypothetical protein
MALQSKREELEAAWRALADYRNDEGWRTITIKSGAPCRLLAGRHFPGNEEALLIGFSSLRIPPTEQLPQGLGFLVSKIDMGTDGYGYSWIALTRNRAGNPDLFARMADDVIATLEKQPKNNDARLLSIFISRIRAWQDFMSRGREEVLSPEAEIGLFGELLFMQDLLNAAIPAGIVVDSWQGPLDGIHDFTLGTGAIEVKATVSPHGFSAKVGSLDQLDDSLIRPLFLVAVRLSINPSGKSLPILIHETREILEAEPVALAGLNSRLLHVGYFESFAERYTRCFMRNGTKILAINESFPRLTRANVPIEIGEVRYEIELDMISSGTLEFTKALKQLGVV